MWGQQPFPYGCFDKRYIMKICTKCKVPKGLDEFGKKSSNKDGIRNYCKPCHALTSRISRENSPYKEENRLRHNERIRNLPKMTKRNIALKKKYNMSHDQYEKMLEHQGGMCKICKIDIDKYHKEYFDIDHCHSTGKVRGLLCHKCNMLLGLSGDNSALLADAAQYLKDK